MPDILIVDDDILTCYSFLTRLNMQGYNASYVNNIEAMWKSIKREKPKVIILDGLLPYCRNEEIDLDNSINATIELGEKHPAISIIICTGLIESSVEEKFQDFPNVISFFYKPISFLELNETIEKVMVI
jgi:DNA-binding NtrC family response regulator